MNRRSLNCPSEADKANGQTGSSVKKEPKTRLILRTLIIWLLITLLDVALDGRNEEQPSNQVSNADGNERKANFNSGKVPLVINESKGLDEHEDECIRKSRQERKHQNNGLREKHLERPHPGNEDLLGREAIPERDKFVRAPDVLAILSASLRNSVHHNGRSGLGNGEEMDNLDKAAENELNPDRPPRMVFLSALVYSVSSIIGTPCLPPVKEFFGKPTHNGSKDGTTDRRKDDIGNSVLLLVSLPEIGNHTKGNRAASRRQTAEGTTNHDGAKVISKGDGKLPDIDQEQGKLEDRPATEFLRPRSPQLASKGIGNEENHGTGSCGLQTNTKVLGDATDGV